MRNKNILASVAAYSNGAGWKVDDEGHIVLKDGNPIYVETNGQEKVVESGTISRLNAEAKEHREAKEALQAKYKPYEGLDAEKAREALATLEKLDAKKLIDSGDVDRLTDQIKSQFSAQLSEQTKALETYQNKYNDLMISNLFSGSEFLRDNIAVPRDMFEATFRNNFKVEDGKVVAYGKDGNRLLSKTRAGEYAEPDEALQLLVESHPQKDVILKAHTGNGTGNNGGGGQRPGGRVIKRGDFEKLPANQQMETVKKIQAGEMSLTD